jgi:hypothetical protein
LPASILGEDVSLDQFAGRRIYLPVAQEAKIAGFKLSGLMQPRSNLFIRHG